MTEGSLLSRPSHLGTYDRLNRLSTKKTLTKESGSCETNRDPTSACQCLNESEHPTSADLALPTQISCRSKLKVAKSLARGVLSPRPMPFAGPRGGMGGCRAAVRLPVCCRFLRRPPVARSAEEPSNKKPEGIRKMQPLGCVSFRRCVREALRTTIRKEGKHHRCCVNACLAVGWGINFRVE